MALEAVHLHRSIGMALLAELTRRVDWDKLPVSIGLGMTGDTPDQAEPGVTHTEIHGFITLMEKHVHVVTPHFFNRRDTAFTPDRLREVQSRRRLIVGPG